MDFKPAPIKPTITLADLEKVDIRVGTIVSVGEVAGSDKLVRLVVDFAITAGTYWRGSSRSARPESLEGTQALFVVNLEPKKMRGELSEGMLFDIGYADGVQPALAVPENNVPNGTRAG